MLSVLFGTLLGLQVAGPPQQPRSDTRTWYQAYAAAKQDIQQKRWAEALADLQVAAQRNPPRPGKNVLQYGDRYGDYLPDYYLGIAYFNLNRFDEADKAFKRVAAARLITDADSKNSAYAEYFRLPALAAKAAAAPAAVATNVPAAAPIVVPPAVTAAAPNVMPQLPNSGSVAGPPPPGDFPSGYQQSPIQAPTSAYQPPSGSSRPPAGAAASPGTTVRSSTVPVARPAAQGPVVAGGVLAAAQMRSAMVEYFSGNYDEAWTRLNGLAAAGNAPPRAYLYLACAAIARSLTTGGDDLVVQQARAQLARAGDTAPFSADVALISPRIRQALRLP